MSVTIDFSVDVGACQWDGIGRVLLLVGFDWADEVVMSPISIYAGGGRVGDTGTRVTRELAR